LNKQVLIAGIVIAVVGLLGSVYLIPAEGGIHKKGAAALVLLVVGLGVAAWGAMSKSTETA
jgi:hypothetical protein